MARGVNKVILVGNLGRDPEMNYTPSGLAVTKINLATTEGRKGQDGEWHDHTEWHRVTLFGKTAETASQYLAKGSQVYFEGKISYGSYEKDGVKHYTTDVIANRMILLGGRGESGGQTGNTHYQSQPPQQGTPPQQQGGSQGQEYEEDLPF